MNLSAVHGIIFLWTELHCWSGMHRPEILLHHLSYSSSSLLGVTTLQTPTPLPHFYPLKEHPPCKDPAVAQSVYPFYCSPLPAGGVLFSFGLPHSSELVLSERGQKKLKYISEIGKCRVFTWKHILMSKPIQWWGQRWHEKRGKNSQNTKPSHWTRVDTRTGQLREETERR